MKKTLLALAIALLSVTAAFGQPSVNDLTPVCMTPYCASKVISVGGQLQDTSTFEILQSRAASQGLINNDANTKSTCITGGTTCATGSGAYSLLFGTSAVGQPGDYEINSGNASGSSIFLLARGASGAINMGAGSSSTDWTLEADGDWVANGTNGGDVIITKTTQAVLQPAATGLTAAGTTIADALQLSSVFNNVTTVAASTGVKLFEKASKVGYSVIVRNSGANSLNVFPPDASGTINGGSAGAAVVCAATEVCHFTKVATNTWIGGVMVVF